MHFDERGSPYEPKFITLTFKENVQCIKTANMEFKLFRQRLEYHLQKKIKYVAVIEFQRRGAIHYHMIIFNIPFLKSKTLEEIWGNGFIKVNKVNQVDNIGAYMGKYMGKDNNQKLAGNKSYFSSRSLLKPVEIIDSKKIGLLTQALDGNLVYQAEYENDYNGLITYRQYNTTRNIVTYEPVFVANNSIL